MKDTKANILKAALKLFNENGFVNVRLQHIADEAFISVGNLAYHFQNKQEILMGLYERIAKAQVELLNELNIVPLFDHLDDHWENVFRVQDEYRFFYIDTLEILRSNTRIEEKYRAHISWEQRQIQQMLQFNISRGSIHIEERPDAIEQLAELIWINENVWKLQMLVKGKSISLQRFKAYLWSIIYPYLTEIGLQEYKQMTSLQDVINTNHSVENGSGGFSWS